MEELLSLVSLWHYPTLIFGIVVVLAIIIVIMIMISWKSGKEFALRIGPIRLLLGSHKEPESESDTIKTSSQNIKEHNIAIDKVVVLKKIIKDSVQKIEAIRNEETLKRQMKFADEKIIEIKSVITNRFAKMLEEKLTDQENAKSHKEYRSYQILIGLLTTEMKERVLKPSLIENHILEYSDTAWEEYIDGKVDTIMTLGCDFVDVMYDYNSKIISSKELTEGNQEILPSIREMIKIIYRKAKIISAEDSKKIEQLELEAENDIKNGLFN